MRTNASWTERLKAIGMILDRAFRTEGKVDLNIDDGVGAFTGPNGIQYSWQAPGIFIHVAKGSSGPDLREAHLSLSSDMMYFA